MTVKNALLRGLMATVLLGSPLTGLTEVSPALVELRRQILDADFNALTFSNADRIFLTRTVPHGEAVWHLPRREVAPDFSYEFDGQRHPASAALERTRTNALLIIKNGEVVHESYRNLTGEATRFIAWSASKSIVSLLVGIALEEGRIESVADPIVKYLPELQNSGYQQATIRDILEMRSGVDYEERYDFENPGIAAQNHEQALVQNKRRFADAAMELKSIHKPGEFFAYKTIDTAVLGWLLERVTQRPVSFYMAEKLWEPVGAERDGFWIMDGEPGVGREFTGAGFNAALMDFGRVGLMVLNGGMANGKQIVSSEWLQESTQSAFPENERGGYGYQWWTAPDSEAFYAAGLQGQFIYIDPPSKTVVVKLSYFPPGDDSAIAAESLAFMAAAAKWKPAQ